MQNVCTVTGNLKRNAVAHQTKTGFACSAKILVGGRFTLTVIALSPVAELLAEGQAGQVVIVTGPLIPTGEINPQTGDPLTSRVHIKAEALAFHHTVESIARAHLGSLDVRHG